MGPQILYILLWRCFHTSCISVSGRMQAMCFASKSRLRFLGHLGVLSTDLSVGLAVTSPQEDRDVMVACLQLGAADYMIKPLRHNELRNLWARVYWWRRVSPMSQRLQIFTAILYQIALLQIFTKTSRNYCLVEQSTT